MKKYFGIMMGLVLILMSVYITDPMRTFDVEPNDTIVMVSDLNLEMDAVTLELPDEVKPEVPIYSSVNLYSDKVIKYNTVLDEPYRKAIGLTEDELKKNVLKPLHELYGMEDLKSDGKVGLVVSNEGELFEDGNPNDIPLTESFLKG